MKRMVSYDRLLRTEKCYGYLLGKRVGKNYKDRSFLTRHIRRAVQLPTGKEYKHYWLHVECLTFMVEMGMLLRGLGIN